MEKYHAAPLSRRPGGAHLSPAWVWVVAVLLSSSGIQVCSACEMWEFRCLNGDCVKGVYRCDTIQHCPDASDELNCTPLVSTHKWMATPCRTGQFQCHNGRCVYPGWRCDGQDDCGDNSDEKECMHIERLPILSMGSIVGLSIAVAGLFIVVIGIAVMLTCIRRKNVMNSREMTRQSHLLSLSQDCHPYSISGMVLGREPPPRYTSQADLTLLPPGVIQEHMAALSMQPPPYYSSQPDLTPAAYCPRILEAPPCYTSQNDLSHPGGGGGGVGIGGGSLEMATDGTITANPHQNALYEMPNPDVGSNLGSVGRHRVLLRSCSKDSTYETSLSDSVLSEPKRCTDAKAEKELSTKEGLLSPGSPVEGGFTEWSGRQSRRLRGLGDHCVSTPALLSDNATSEGICDLVQIHGAPSPTNQHSRRCRSNKMVDASGNTRCGVPLPCRRKEAAGQPRIQRCPPQQHSHSMVDLPESSSDEVLRTRTTPESQLALPAPSIEPQAATAAAKSGDHQGGQKQEECLTRCSQGPLPTAPHAAPFKQQARGPGVGVHRATSRRPPRVPKPRCRSVVRGLQAPGPSALASLGRNPNGLQAQKRLSKSMSTLTGTSVQRNDSFNSVSSWDC